MTPNPLRHCTAFQKFSQSIRGNLILIILVLLVPILMIQAFAYYNEFKIRQSEDLHANLEEARAAGRMFESFVRETFGDELVLGFACSALHRSTNMQNRILLQALKTNRTLWLLSWASPTGTVLASTDSKYIGRNLYDNPFFKGLASGLGLVVTHLVDSDPAGRNHFFIGRAVRNENGDFMGVLIAGVLPERLDMAIGMKRSRGEIVGLVDQLGRLAFSNPPVNSRWKEHGMVAAYPMIKDALKSKEVYGRVASRLDGVNRLVSFVPIPSIGWVAVAIRPESYASAEIMNALLPATAICLLVTIAGFVIAIAFSHKVSNSIKKLRDYALALGRGEQEQPASPSGITELDDLIIAFNRMSEELLAREEELRKSRDELELRVRERTADLESANEKLRLVPSILIEAQENERQRLSMELHDSIGQTIAALKFRIEHVITALEQREHTQAHHLLQELVPILQRSLDETRTIYMSLRPILLTEHGILATLDWYRRELLTLYPDQHIEIETKIREENIPENFKIAIFRIAQEGLNNALKHGKPEWVDLRLALNDDIIELEISDDGIGMDLDAVMESRTGKNLGLIGMRERVEFTGGRITIASTPGEGTSIRVYWPIRQLSQCR
jgi:signal transduction histidine kinase